MRISPAPIALATGMLLAISGCTSFGTTLAEESAAARTSAAATSSEFPQADIDPIDLDDCTDQIRSLGVSETRPLGYECGYLDVPISYHEADSTTLPMFVLRIRSATQTDRIGSLVVNPGGPGGSGADAALSLAQSLPDEVLARFDIVGFDPRGVGLTTPVECFSAEEKDRYFAAEPRPATPDQLEPVFDLYDEIAQNCAAEYGDALGAFDTVDTARDMDRLRASLGDDQLTYLGYSYGTTLGSTYAELFPDRVRALVLDGAVDPEVDQSDVEAQLAAQEAAFDAFANACTSLLAGCPIGADPRQFLNDLLARAAGTPVPSAAPGETRTATPGLIMTAVLSALYDNSSWPQLNQALRAAGYGDSAGVLALADAYTQRLDDGSYTNLFDALFTINCADTAEDESVSRAEATRLAADWNTRFPLFGANAAAGQYLCTPWQAPRTPLPERDAAGSAPILVVGNTGDPVTPLPGAVDMAQDLDAGVLITWQGQGHTSYPKTPCITDVVDRYLIDLVVPQDGLVCPAF